jgi:hypothetical protein
VRLSTSSARPTSRAWVAAAWALGLALSIAPAAAACQPMPNKSGAAPTNLEHPTSRLNDARIYTWIGNTRAWDQKLHVSGYRLGCDRGDPQICLGDAANAVKEEGLNTIFLSLPEDAYQTPLDAQQVSAMSVSRHYLVEVGFDDFVDRYEKLFTQPSVNPPSWLENVYLEMKSSNQNLAFGITLYEDELDSPYLRPPQLPSALARDVGFVHLYLHYRADAQRLPQYVKLAKSLFPDARIIAGLYAYDRIDYIPCSPANARPCTQSEELRFYEQAATQAARLLENGAIFGIEFYPGFFGREDAWPGWKNRDYCAPARVEQCIRNTRLMRDKTVTILSSTLGWQ